MNLNCIIVDDEPLAIELLEGYVKRTPFLNLVGTYMSAIMALDALKSTSVQLIFCDVQMPHLNGMEFSRMLPPTTKVIFTTAFGEYALEGFKVNALDYLLKPISYTEFLGAANRALEWFNREATAAETVSQATTPVPDSIFVKSNHRLVQVKLSSILYIESLRDYVRIFQDGNAEPIMALMPLKILEQQLPPQQFMRVHRSFLVQLSKVRVIERNRIVFGKNYIPISDANRDEFFQRLSQLSIMIEDK